MSFEPIVVSPSSNSIAANSQVEAVETAPAKIQWRVPEIDGVRAFAMLMVVLFHAWECTRRAALPVPFLGFDLSRVIEIFPAGVDLFMVLSGFCLFLPLCRKSREEINFDSKKYAIRRVRRIVPPYYAAIAFAVILPNILVLLFHLMGKEAKWQGLPSALQLITHFTFTHLFFVETWGGITGAFWSLSLEVQFYLIFPLVVFLYKRYGIKVVWWMVAASVLYRIGVAIGFEVTGNYKPGYSSFRFLWNTNLAGRWMQFAAGIWAAYFVSDQWKNAKKINGSTGTLIILASIGIFALGTLPMPEAFRFFPIRDVLLSVSYASLIIAVCVTPTKFRVFFGSRVMAWLGYISYTVFLIHQPILYYCSEFLRRFSNVGGPILFLLILSIGFAATLLISLPFFRFFERPFLNASAKPKPEVEVAA